MKCHNENCNNERTGKGRYCKECRPAARAAWKKMIAEQAAEKAKRYKGFAALAKRLPGVVKKAGGTEVPGINVGVKLDGRSSFAHWAVKNGKANRVPGTGVIIPAPTIEAANAVITTLKSKDIEATVAVEVS